jgi:hypothetical protein
LERRRLEDRRAVNAVLAAGYPYEIAGLVFYVFFLYQMRKRGGARYSLRSRTLTIIAAIGLVGVVPFHYASSTPLLAVVLLLAFAALASAFIDTSGVQR